MALAGARRPRQRVSSPLTADEYQVEGSDPFRLDLRQRFECPADTHVDAIGKPGPRDIRRGMAGIRLQGDHRALPRQGPRQPDRAVTSERADFEYRLRPGKPRDQMQQFALQRRNVESRQSGVRIRSQRGVEYRIDADKQIGKITIDRVPASVGLIHFVRFSAGSHRRSLALTGRS